MAADVPVSRLRAAIGPALRGIKDESLLSLTAGQARMELAHFDEYTERLGEHVPDRDVVDLYADHMQVDGHAVTAAELAILSAYTGREILVLEAFYRSNPTLCAPRQSGTGPIGPDSFGGAIDPALDPIILLHTGAGAGAHFDLLVPEELGAGGGDEGGH
jgi:hypothetical protein